MPPLGLIGPLSRDVVAGAPPRIGGGPWHATRALHTLRQDAVVVAKCGEADRSDYQTMFAREEGAVADDHIMGEIGEVHEGKIPGRRSDAEITLFKSLGIAVEDLAAGMHVYRKAAGRGGASDL